MNRIAPIKKAARDYCKEIATIDVQSGAIHGNMKTVFSYPSIEAAFIAGAEWYRYQLSFPVEIHVNIIKQFRTKYCDECVHFIPSDDSEEDVNQLTDFSELCEFKKKLKFRMPPQDDYMSYDYGFYCPGCKDWKECKRTNKNNLEYEQY